MTVLAMIGAPSSAGSYSAGQEKAPTALREAGLIEALTAAGHTVRDLGDLTEQTWRPGRERRYAQNLPEVVHSVRELAEAATAPLAAGERLLVLGGNCTVALGVCSAMRRAGHEPGLVYVDRHLDLNTPSSTAEGALDWMGVAHGLGLEGTAPELVDILGPRPLLVPSRVCFLGTDRSQATEWERAQRERCGLRVVPQDELVRAPSLAAREARGPTSPDRSPCTSTWTSSISSTLPWRRT